MTEFKKGDKVLCVDNNRIEDSLNIGETYTVENDDDGIIKIGGQWYYASRFKPVELATLAAPFNQSKATTTNPKDLFGSLKVSITKFPAIGLAHGAHAMMDGATKYGPYNWRDKDVIASIYVDAAVRHLLDWFEGQEQAKDSGVHHLGHAMACCAILLDAQENGALIDDRPVFDNPDVLDKVLDRLSAIIKARKEAQS